MGSKNSLKHTLTDQRGSILLGGLLLVFAVTILGIGLFQAATVETRDVQFSQRDVQAFYAADTGVNRAAVDMADPGAPPAIGTMCFDTADHLPSALCPTPVKPAVMALAPGTTLTVYPGTTCFGGASCDNANPKIPAYLVEAKNHPDVDKFWLIATACIPGPAQNPCPFTARAAAQVQTLLVKSPGAPGIPTIPWAIFGASPTANPAVKISSLSSSPSLVDSYDSRSCASSPCAYGSVTHLQNGDVAANGGIAVKGTFNGDIINLTNVTGTDVKIESGTTVSGSVTYSGASTYSNSGTVSGGFTQQADQPKTLGTLNNCGPYISNTDMGSRITQYTCSGDPAGKCYGGAGKVVPQSLWSYSSSTGALSVNTGSPSTGWVVLAPGDYCLGSLSATGGSLIKTTDMTVVTSNGTVSMSGGSFANTTSDPQNLQLIATSSSSVTLSGNSGAYMVVYAPSATVNINGSGNIYGAVIGNSVVASGGAAVHYDECLGKTTCATKLRVGINNSTTSTYALSSWRQFTCRQTSPTSSWTCS